MKNEVNTDNSSSETRPLEEQYAANRRSRDYVNLCMSVRGRQIAEALAVTEHEDERDGWFQISDTFDRAQEKTTALWDIVDRLYGEMSDPKVAANMIHCFAAAAPVADLQTEERMQEITRPPLEAPSSLALEDRSSRVLKVEFALNVYFAHICADCREMSPDEPAFVKLLNEENANPFVFTGVKITQFPRAEYGTMLFDKYIERRYSFMETYIFWVLGMYETATRNLENWCSPIKKEESSKVPAVRAERNEVPF